MIRLVFLSGQWYSTEVATLYSDSDNAETFIDEGSAVMYAQSYDDIPKGIDYLVS